MAEQGGAAEENVLVLEEEGVEGGVAPVDKASLADIAPAVLRSYFNEYPNTFLTQHHIASYETFVFRELADILHAENPITILKEPIAGTVGAYQYKTEIFIGGDVADGAALDLDVGPPIITLDEGRTVRRMFPNEARIRNLTYAANFQASVLVRITLTAPAATAGAIAPPWKPAETAAGVPEGFVAKVYERKFERFPLFNLPALLRSKLCATHSADRDLLWEMGECRNDQGGYFIIDGAEKLLITRQEQAFNSLYVTDKPQDKMADKVSIYAAVLCQHPTTKLTRRVTLYLYKHAKIRGVEFEDSWLRRTGAKISWVPFERIAKCWF